MITDEELVTVRAELLTLMLKLPDGCTPGRWEAAEAFAEIIAEMRKRHPSKTFQLLPFSYDTLEDGTNPAISAVLAIAN
ncbi:MAG: hypothetical protein HYT49_00025 [Candidatus Wildermuthbacteria bacterium]|nr:hypothetical protein [Candidatus Wildermuthbacteria bacterium]